MYFCFFVNQSMYFKKKVCRNVQHYLLFTFKLNIYQYSGTTVHNERDKWLSQESSPGQVAGKKPQTHWLCGWQKNHWLCGWQKKKTLAVWLAKKPLAVWQSWQKSNTKTIITIPVVVYPLVLVLVAGVLKVLGLATGVSSNISFIMWNFFSFSSNAVPNSCSIFRFSFSWIANKNHDKKYIQKKQPITINKNGATSSIFHLSFSWIAKKSWWDDWMVECSHGQRKALR